ncbi:thiamine phosphate synthase [Paenibacillus sp. YN15]|uniref:thiamine phosphate synthase n=1 Tax=Paenibacillus sp. YN15 TaxID=1742774 RepID=UPI000DCD1AE7|nr:thiamine phosphate synthase [Paenibacillus sp. YN15]RAV04556.1 thiamine phosphate synthase [Paenibacillus sp. YN15]
MSKVVDWNGRPLREWLKLYLVMDMQSYGGRTAAEIAREAIAGGVTMIQWREKSQPLREVLEESRRLRALCREQGIPFVVNDRVDIALILDADGVHVGQDDLPAQEVRKLMGPDRFVGVSAGSWEEAQWALEQQADYLGVGPVYGTPTKPDAGEAIGFELLARLAAECGGVPRVGIGGINRTNAGLVMGAGADGIAVVSAITRSNSPLEAAAELNRLVRQHI